ncbi:MAG: metallophosphoesterase family protein [Bacteroidota bacterium]
MNYRKQIRLPANARGNDYVITDIHGCHQTFFKLLERLNLSIHKDRLFILGDCVNKGPNSKAVIDRVLELKKEYEVYVLRGNHEQMLLDFSQMSKYEFEWHLTGLNSRTLADDDLKLIPKYKEFLIGLPYYIDLPEYYLVHAGFDFKQPEPFKAYETMIWIRGFQLKPELLNGKQIVHGHIPNILKRIESAIESKSGVIPLDNGCVYHGKKEGQGNLLCFELNAQELIVQENVED